MKNLNNYKRRFNILMESEMGDVKPLIMEEGGSTYCAKKDGIWVEVLKSRYDKESVQNRVKKADGFNCWSLNPKGTPIPKSWAKDDRYFFCDIGNSKEQISKDEAIRRQYGVYVSDRPCRMGSSPGSEIYVHTVESGENLTNIIKNYKTASDITPEVVAKINDIPDMNKIDVGQKIIIPLDIR